MSKFKIEELEFTNETLRMQLKAMDEIITELNDKLRKRKPRKTEPAPVEDDMEVKTDVDMTASIVCDLKKVVEEEGYDRTFRVGKLFYRFIANTPLCDKGFRANDIAVILEQSGFIECYELGGVQCYRELKPLPTRKMFLQIAKKYYEGRKK